LSWLNWIYSRTPKVKIFFKHFATLLHELHKMAISNFRYGEFRIFSGGFYCHKYGFRGAIILAPSLINFAWLAESNDTNFESLVLPEDPLPTLPVGDRKFYDFLNNSFQHNLNILQCAKSNFTANLSQRYNF
jgi:hypothetical protein